MTDIVQDIESIFGAEPAQRPATIVDDIEAILTPQERTPIDPRTLRMRGSPTPDLAAFGNWVQSHPQAAMDFIAQGLGTTLGIAGGALTSPVTGPVGPIVGGGAGNVAGKQLSRRVGEAMGLSDSEPAPEILSTETAIDAGLGGIGPAAGSVLRSGARALTGLRQRPFNAAVNEAHASVGSAERALQAQAEFEALNRGASDVICRTRSGGRSASQEIAEEATRQREMEFQRAVKDAIERASKEAVERSGETRTSVQRGLGGAVVGGLASVEPVTGALIGAGLSEAVLSRAVPALLSSPRFAEPFARWALNTGTQRWPEAKASLAAVFAGHVLSAQERAARDAIMGERRSGPRSSETLGGERDSNLRFDEGTERWRDPAGRFASSAIDHSGHPVRDGARIDGSHPDDEEDAEQ